MTDRAWLLKRGRAYLADPTDGTRALPAEIGRISGGRSHKSAVPRQVPPPVRHFIGRSAELQLLDSLLAESVEMNVVAIDGAAGVGKTALAIYWAHRTSGKFPDGQLYVNLHGFGLSRPPLIPADALYGMLLAFGIAVNDIPVGLEARAGLYRSVLAGRQVLLLLDNAKDAEQVRHLLPGSPTCMVVITSRRQLIDLVAAQNARRLTLGSLSSAESTRLLSRHLGPARLEGEPEAVADIVASCDRLPLALSVIAARVAANPALPLTRLAIRMRDPHTRLEVLTGESSINLRGVFSYSYAQLSKAAQEMFRRLGLLAGGRDVTVSAAASLVGCGPEQARHALAELASVHLIEEQNHEVFTLSDLMHAYAADLARQRRRVVESIGERA